MLSTMIALASVPSTVLEFILQKIFPIAVIILVVFLIVFLSYVYLKPDWRLPKLPPEPDPQTTKDDTSSVDDR